MLVHFGLGLLRPEWARAVVCIGTFDGVHLGHQEVIRTAVNKARALELPCVLVTFDRNPVMILAPDKCPPSVSTLAGNLAQIKKLGVAATVVLPFDESLSNMSAGDFLGEILVSSLRAESVVVGHDFAMGHGRQGTTTWLSERIETTVVPPFLLDEVRVSSSAVRAAVAEGLVEQAARYLGRPFSLSGIVVPGQKLGRQLGYPTANLARSVDQVVPLDGIYACVCKGAFGAYVSAASIGKRPTVEGIHRTIEAFLLDYSGPTFYGQSVELQFHARLRDELRFPGLEELKAQMAVDVAETRRLVGLKP